MMDTYASMVSTNCSAITDFIIVFCYTEGYSLIHFKRIFGVGHEFSGVTGISGHTEPVGVGHVGSMSEDVAGSMSEDVAVSMRGDLAVSMKEDVAKTVGVVETKH